MADPGIGFAICLKRGGLPRPLRDKEGLYPQSFNSLQCTHLATKESPENRLWSCLSTCPTVHSPMGNRTCRRLRFLFLGWYTQGLRSDSLHPLEDPGVPRVVI